MATPHATGRHRDERGAVLIQVAVAMLALLALSSFVFDYGVMWVSRGQAQNAADAGALSGAISLAFDSGTDQDGARAKAIAVARRNRVWSAAPDITDADVTFPPCPPGAPGLPDTCVKVDVFRNQRPGGNPLPTFFSRLVNITEQGVRATATAQIITGDTTDCLKPWAVIDRWDEYDTATNGAEAEYPEPDPDFLPTSTFDRYSTGQGNSPPPENDLYVRPTPAQVVPEPGSGCPTTRDAALRSRWTRTPTRRCPPAGSARFGCHVSMARTGATSTGRTSRPAAGCPRATPRRTRSARPTSGTTTWPTGRSADAMRPSPATWLGRAGRASRNSSRVTAARRGEATGIVGSTFSPATSSPRVVPIGVIDIDDFLSQDPSGANGVLRMVNIYGFFIEGMGDVDPATGPMTLSPGGHAVIGRIMTIPSMGTWLVGAPEQRVVPAVNHSRSLKEDLVATTVTIIGSRDLRLEELCPRLRTPDRDLLGLRSRNAAPVAGGAGRRPARRRAPAVACAAGVAAAQEAASGDQRHAARRHDRSGAHAGGHARGGQRVPRRAVRPGGFQRGHDTASSASARRRRPDRYSRSSAPRAGSARRRWRSTSRRIWRSSRPPAR